MKNFENVELPQDKFGLHQTCTIYCGVVALSIAYLVGLEWTGISQFPKSLKQTARFFVIETYTVLQLNVIS